MRAGDDKSDDELFEMVLAAEDESFLNGCEPKRRSSDVPARVMKRLGYHCYVEYGASSPKVYKRICRIHESLYRPKDFAIGGMHGGFFMFRDVFCRIDIPHMFGTVKLEPLELTDLSLNQKRWLVSRPHDFRRFVEQFSAVFDFAGGVYGLGGYKQPPESAQKFFLLAGFQLQSAAATLNAAYDYRGATQSAILATELALKGGLVGFGYDEVKLSDKIKHNNLKAARLISDFHPDFDLKTVIASLMSMPAFVKNRYDFNQPSRKEVGEIVMSAQFISAEVVRLLSKHSVQTNLESALKKFQL